MVTKEANLVEILRCSQAVEILSQEVRKTRTYGEHYNGDGTALSIVAFGYQQGLLEAKGLSTSFQNLLKQAYQPSYKTQPELQFA